MSIAKTALKGVVYHNREKACDGYTLFATYNNDVWLIDMEGRIVHKWWVPYTPGAHMVLLENGNLFYSAHYRTNADLGLATEMAGLGGLFLEIDWNSRLVWKMEVPYQHHDFSIHPDTRNVIFPTYHSKGQLPGEMAAQIKGGLPGTEYKNKIWGDVLFEINRYGEIIWEWKASDHLDPEIDMLNPLEGRLIYPYINSVMRCGNGDLLLSCRHISTILRLDYESGSIIKRYGRGQLSHQHDAREIPNGNIMAFDNGTQRYEYKPSCSRIVEFDGKTGKIVWEYKADFESDFFSSVCSGAERLSNGNTVICEAVMGRIFEVTPEKEIVWEYISPLVSSHLGQETTMMWRAHRYEKGYPGLEGKDLDHAKYKIENRLFGPTSFILSFNPIIL